MAAARPQLDLGTIAEMARAVTIQGANNRPGPVPAPRFLRSIAYLVADEPARLAVCGHLRPMTGDDLDGSGAVLNEVDAPLLLGSAGDRPASAAADR